MNKYFDIQVNGYAGVDFNQNNLSAENLTKACHKLKEDCNYHETKLEQYERKVKL